ncbi:MAG: hypothetical protein EOP60_06295 [Sphingomonadales bacterium]|nr:MAG: hypothetical protein EOP60_06295 [Sphingomonadales bacterium]
MTDDDSPWSLSNPGPDSLLVWLEPWAEEFDVPARSAIALKSLRGSQACRLGEVEGTPDHLIVWASAETVQVYIDGVVQESSSALIPVPDGLTKQMMKVLFAGHPAARLGGTGFNDADGLSWWGRLRRRLGW